MYGLIQVALLSTCFCLLNKQFFIYSIVISKTY